MLQGNWIFLPALKCSFARGLFSREAAMGSLQPLQLSTRAELCNYTASAILMPQIILQALIK